MSVCYRLTAEGLPRPLLLSLRPNAFGGWDAFLREVLPKVPRATARGMHMTSPHVEGLDAVVARFARALAQALGGGVPVTVEDVDEPVIPKEERVSQMDLSRMELR